MAKSSLELIKKLREETGAGVVDCRTALEENDGDIAKAKEFLVAKGLEKAAKKADRVANSGLVFAYIHGGGKVGAMVEIACETDFVAKTDEYNHLAKEIAMQVASMDAKDLEELLAQSYIRDSKMTIDGLVKSAVAKIGENIMIKRFVRYGLGEEIE